MVVVVVGTEKMSGVAAVAAAAAAEAAAVVTALAEVVPIVLAELAGTAVARRITGAQSGLALPARA